MRGTAPSSVRPRFRSPVVTGWKSQTEGSVTSSWLTTAVTSWVRRAKSPAQVLYSSSWASPRKKTTPSCTCTSGLANQPVASRMPCSRARISSSRAVGSTSTLSGASITSSSPVGVGVPAGSWAQATGAKTMRLSTRLSNSRQPGRAATMGVPDARFIAFS